MNIVSKMNHESNIKGKVSYASYTWSLSHWFLLYDHYKDGIVSPAFEFMQGEECQCELTFKSNSRRNAIIQGYSQSVTSAVMEVKFIGDFKFHSMRATVSFVDKNMEKLLTVKSASHRSIATPLNIYFDESVTETSVAKYLQEDTLILFFELYVVKAIDTSPVSTNTWDSNLSTVVRDRFEDLLKTNQLCDVTFVVQDQTLSAHKLVVAANSEVFRAMFATDMKEQKEGKVEIKDVDAEVFKIFLRYMYTGIVKNTEEMVTELIVVANRYQVIDLVKLCETYMMAHLQIANATQYLLTAHQLVCLPLEEKAIIFMKRNTQILANPAEYKLLSDYPSLISRIFG